MQTESTSASQQYHHDDRACHYTSFSYPKYKFHTPWIYRLLSKITKTTRVEQQIWPEKCILQYNNQYLSQLLSFPILCFLSSSLFSETSISTSPFFSLFFLLQLNPSLTLQRNVWKEAYCHIVKRKSNRRKRQKENGMLSQEKNITMIIKRKYIQHHGKRLEVEMQAESLHWSVGARKEKEKMYPRHGPWSPYLSFRVIS